jgi:YidC/Oxa1 family membrane protein insertase
MKFLLLAALLLASTALAQTGFTAVEFPVTEFRGLDKVVETCALPAAASFWCDMQDEVLTLIPTKGADFFFDDAGELVAVYAKQQKGQRLSTYAIDNAQNLIPNGARIPGAAVLLDGEHLRPDNVSGSWQQVTDTEFEGNFEFTLDGVQISKRVQVSNITHIVSTWITATRTGDGEAGAAGAGEETSGAEGTLVQLAFPGLGRQATPVTKVGVASTFQTNPLPQPVPDATYISLQTNDKNTGYAIVMRPAGTGEQTPLALGEAVDTPGAPETLAAQSLPGNLIAMQATLGPAAGDTAVIATETYTGPNELVRFNQEGFADFPGLFRPNILGQMSLGLIWLLVRIHEFVGSWGVAIMLLTLIFRAAIWPLISTQTKSMFAMQQLQPRIQALQKKYKDDREKLTQETMKLYKEEGVNPAGGCLPMLLQMPLFIILWRVFVNFEFNEGFLWLPDLGRADPFYILPVLYVGVMLAQSFFSTRGNPSQFRQQIFINLVFVFIIVNFPSGVILYFVVSMLVQVIQYWLLSRSRSTVTAVATK